MTENPSVVAGQVTPPEGGDRLWFGPLGVGAEGTDPGLVTSQTSDTSNQQILIDTASTRLRRMRSAVLTAARLHCQEVPRWRVAMLTPTYAKVGGWSARHISDLLKSIRNWMARRGHDLRYTWVMELQERGAPHYHILIWLPRGLSLPKPDKQGWWRHGSTKIEWARNAVGYIAKYASKVASKAGGKIPRGARIHGAGGHTGAALREFRWWKLPRWLRETVSADDCCSRFVGGGWLSRLTGELFESPWRVFFSRGSVYMVPKASLVA